MRLDRFIAKALNVPRSAARRIIREGRVEVGGKVVRDISFKVEHGEVRLDGEVILPKEKVYIILYKPKGYLSTTERKADYPSFLDLLGEGFGSRKLFAAGRLDVDTEGLLLITDDGELAHRLTHPRWKVEKEYMVELDRRFGEDFETLKRVVVDGKPVDLISVKRLSDRVLKLIIREGRYRIIKRLFGSLGYRVLNLKRIRIGSLVLEKELKPGDWRELKEEEVVKLKREVNLS